MPHQCESCRDDLEDGDDCVVCHDGTFWHRDCYCDADYCVGGTICVYRTDDYIDGPNEEFAQ